MYSLFAEQMTRGQQMRNHSVSMTLELMNDKKDYEPGEKVKLMVNTEREDSFVLLFVRPSNGVYLKPQTLQLKGKSTFEAIEVTKKDMPNFFVEAITISNGKLHTVVKEIIVPPEKAGT